MVFNATLNSISVYIVTVSFIGGGNPSTWRKPPTLTNFITWCYIEYTLPWTGVWTHYVSGDRHWL